MKDAYKMRLCTTLLVLNLLFIWGNSMLPATASDAVSSGALEWLSWLFDVFGDYGHKILRKLAHMTEFAFLGLLLNWFWQLRGQRGIHRIALASLCGLLAACVDESIQILSPGRSSSLIDVWIDMGGFCAGMILIWIGQAIFKKKKDPNFNGGKSK